MAASSGAAASSAGGAAGSACLSPSAGAAAAPKPPPTRHGPEPRELARDDFTQEAGAAAPKTKRQRRQLREHKRDYAHYRIFVDPDADSDEARCVVGLSRGRVAGVLGESVAHVFGRPRSGTA